MSNDNPIETPADENLTEWIMISRICGAAAFGAAVGFERASRDKAAKVGMHMLVAVGAATFTSVALLNTNTWRSGDVNRVPAGIASGVGFLGAGTIFKSNDSVKGLKTAAGLWSVAAIGYCVAAGYWYLALFSTVIVLVVQLGTYLFYTIFRGERLNGRTDVDEIVHLDDGDNKDEEARLVGDAVAESASVRQRNNGS